MRPKWIEVAGAGHENIFEYEQARVALRDLWTSVRTAPPGRRGAQAAMRSPCPRLKRSDRGSQPPAEESGVGPGGRRVAASARRCGASDWTENRHERQEGKALHKPAHAAKALGPFLRSRRHAAGLARETKASG